MVSKIRNWLNLQFLLHTKQGQEIVKQIDELNEGCLMNATIEDWTSGKVKIVYCEKHKNGGLFSLPSITGCKKCKVLE